jgi:hypothetical protein
VKLCDAELDEEEEDEDGPAPLLLLTTPCTAFCFWYHCGGDGSTEAATASTSGDAVPSAQGVVEPPPALRAPPFPATTLLLGVAVGLSAGCVQVLKLLGVAVAQPEMNADCALSSRLCRRCLLKQGHT